MPFSVTVQSGLCQTWSDPRRPVFSWHGYSKCFEMGKIGKGNPLGRFPFFPVNIYLTLLLYLHKAVKKILTSLACIFVLSLFNPYLRNGFANHYYLDESTLIFLAFRSDFKILFKFSMKFLQANRIALDARLK